MLLVTDPGIRDGRPRRAGGAVALPGRARRCASSTASRRTRPPIHVGKGVIVAREFKPDLIIGLGGGSSMDCAKGINFLLTNGGRMQDYWGVEQGDASRCSR